MCEQSTLLGEVHDTIPSDDESWSAFRAQYEFALIELVRARTGRDCTLSEAPDGCLVPVVDENAPKMGRLPPWFSDSMFATDPRKLALELQRTLREDGLIDAVARLYSRGLQP
ncbi:MAG: hypothetical protein ACOY0T_37405 [Myxococcota bacterium]